MKNSQNNFQVATRNGVWYRRCKNKASMVISFHKTGSKKDDWRETRSKKGGIMNYSLAYNLVRSKVAARTTQS